MWLLQTKPTPSPPTPPVSKYIVVLNQNQMNSHGYTGVSEEGRPSGSGSGFGKWPPRDCLPRWDLQPGSGFCAKSWEEEAHPQRGLLCLDICPQGQERDMCYEGPPLLLTPFHSSRIFPMGLAVACGLVKVIQHLWSVYAENSGRILITCPQRVHFPMRQIPDPDSLGPNPHPPSPTCVTLDKFLHLLVS